ncbi:DUF3515 domain-containing protein [Pseudonocardia spinosispora]|uniref:DUF3515 domain-containing protein n=1 Tax=Pseudonocardia spinosispora TaxID=103441 RepID=UPI0006876469|nr:DUF3515 domain-containing protein [Pseudonocardia spinosispora]
MFALPALLVVAAVVLGLVYGRSASVTPPADNDRPLALVPVDAPDAKSESCVRLLQALPGELSSGGDVLHRLRLADPAPDGAAAWGRRDQSVVLRCGLPRPAELTPTSELIAIDKVGWLVLSEPEMDTFITADRQVYVALTVPRGLGTAPIQTISDKIATTLPPRTG